MNFTKQKENAASGFWRNPGTDPMISFQPSDKVGHSDPKNKYHAINSVYYIFSIQVYITFLSIQVHIIIHIVLLCLLGCIFSIFKVLVNFGSQLFFQFVKQSCNMSTLLFVCGLGRGGVVVGRVQSYDQTSVRQVFHTNAAVFHIRSKTKVSEGGEGDSCCCPPVSLTLV